MYYTLCFGVIVLVAIRSFIKYTRRNGSYNCLIGKTVVVTGANTGIGYYTALDFAMRGARVILACRNEKAAREAQNRIIKETNNPNVIVKIINLLSLKSVRNFAVDFNATEERLDILVNNAGAGILGDNYTEDNLQITMQVNHFSPFLLTILLLKKLKQSTPSRIVNVASFSGYFSLLKPEELNYFPKGFFADAKAYANSKLCNILFTRVLAAKLKGSGISVNALHPGCVHTDLFRNVFWPFSILFNFITRIFLKNSEDGAQTSIYTALSKDLNEITGAMFDNCRKVAMYWNATNMDFCKEIWRRSEELVHLTEEEKKYL